MKTKLIQLSPRTWGIIAALAFVCSSAQGTVVRDDVGDTTSTARSVSLPSATSASINFAGDRDVFRVTLSARLEITAFTTGSTDTYGEVLNSSGTIIAYNDDYNGGANFRTVNVLTAGTYYIRVRHFSSTRTGSYVLSVSSRVPLEPEIRVRGKSVEIVKGDTTPSATDGTSFGALYSNSYTDSSFMIDNLGVADLRLTSSSVVWLSGSGASQFGIIALPSSTISPSRSSTFTVRFRPTAVGAFYATVNIASNDYDEGSYTFTISGTGRGILDDHGNTTSAATTISLNRTVAGNLETGGDVDYFRFTLTGSASVVIQTTGSIDTYGYLLNSSGSLLNNPDSDDDMGDGENFRISKVLSAGTYYVKACGYYQTTTGSYSLTNSAFAVITVPVVR